MGISYYNRLNSYSIIRYIYPYSYINNTVKLSYQDGGTLSSYGRLYIMGW